jgi:pyruvate/2-oxoglutarate dehydrogenase complex dihydrolipoamide dehydrogenase (E3) component/uncharacterized membrane protein YdjX (TVP38/TMEM64 family)
VKRGAALAVAALVVVAAVAAMAGDLGALLSLPALQAHLDDLRHASAAAPVAAAALYFAGYVAVAALSVPGALVMTLAGGALFGVAGGTVLVSFASTLGACLAMLAARTLLRDFVKRHFAGRLAAIDAGVARDGAFYLFALRLVPAVPFFVVNLAMGLTPIRTGTFWWVSQLGMLPATFAYVNVGTRLAQVDSLAGLLSPLTLLSFAVLGVLPLAARLAVGVLRSRRVYAGWPRPRRFDYNLVVIGGGSAGLVAAYIGAATRARVALVEAHRMGGDCLNTGCIPSKALLRSAQLLADLARAPEFGIGRATPEVRFADVMARVQRVIETVAPHDSAARYRALGVECIAGKAVLTSPWTVAVTLADGGQRTLSSRSIVIAAGARPVVPPLPGLAEAGYLTSETLWSLRELPRRLVVLGGGPIGCELAQAFARLGAEVTLVERGPRLLPREDPDASAAVAARFAADGVRVRLDTCAVRVERDGAGQVLVTARVAAPAAAPVTAPSAPETAPGTRGAPAPDPPAAEPVPFDRIIVAVGRVGNTAGYGLDTLGIPVTPGGTIETDAWLRTRYPNILACGDVAGPWQFTHTAAHQAWYAAVNGLFGRFRRFRVDARVIPWCTFTDPQVARVGLNEQDARAGGIAHEVTVYGIDDLDRAIADSSAVGFVKVLTPPRSDRILGVTLVGAHAGDLIAEFVLAMKHGLGLNRILGTIHIYPTLTEANKQAAGQWRRAQVTAGQREFLQAAQAWLRGQGRLWTALARLPAALTDRRRAGDGGSR